MYIVFELGDLKKGNTSECQQFHILEGSVMLLHKVKVRTFFLFGVNKFKEHNPILRLYILTFGNHPCKVLVLSQWPRVTLPLEIYFICVITRMTNTCNWVVIFLSWNFLLSFPQGWHAYIYNSWGYLPCMLLVHPLQQYPEWTYFNHRYRTISMISIGKVTLGLLAWNVL